LVTIEVVDPDIGSQIEAAYMPFEGISAGLKGTAADAIEIMLGEASDRHLTHSVLQPTRLWFRETEQGAHEGLDIESGDGSKTLVRFRVPARPELLDGLASQEPEIS
ncbi:MAG TPA: DUF5335 family protein, partial [Bryobacterales bacterium]|nr:DUF5335 family protein [Bryobacterales bacterium]